MFFRDGKLFQVTAVVGIGGGCGERKKEIERDREV